MDAPPPPAVAPPHHLHPRHQQQRGEQIQSQVETGVGRQESEVGEQAGGAQQEHAPEVAPPQEQPAAQKAQQPGGADQPERERRLIDADGAGAGGPGPQRQSFPQFGGAVQFPPVERERGHLPDHRQRAQRQPQQQRDAAPQRQAVEGESGQQPQQQQPDQVGRRRPVRPFHHHHDHHQIQGKQQQRRPPVRRPQRPRPAPPTAAIIPGAGPGSRRINANPNAASQIPHNQPGPGQLRIRN